MRRLIGVAAIIAMVVGLAPAVAAAEPGDLDGAFGTCGFGGTDSWPRGNDVTESVVSLPRGRTLHTYVNHDNHPAATRLDPGGRIDPTYGTDGTVTVKAMRAQGRAPSTYVAADGTVYFFALVKGATRREMAVARINPAGVFDASFGTNGFVNLAGMTGGLGAAVQPDGRLVVAATGDIATFRRLDNTGTADPSFTEPAALIATQNVLLVTADPWGRIVLLTREWAEPERFGVFRLLPEGTADPGLATLLDLPEPSRWAYRGMAMEARADGTVDIAFARSTIGGELGDYGKSVVVALDSDGAPVSTFGPNGSRVLDVPGNSTPGDVTRLADGSIVITGTSGGPDLSGAYSYLQHLSATGAADPSFPPSQYFLIDTPGAFANTRGLAVSADHFDIGAAARGSLAASAVLRVRRDALVAGAGLALQWNGLMWPTRFGRNGGPMCPDRGPYWPDTDTARGVSAVAGKGGFVVDAFGKLYRFSLGISRPKPNAARGNPVWPGWDIARGVAAKLDGSGGYTLDAFGGLHPWHTGSNPNPPMTIGGPYWPGWDITRGVALMPDGTRGYLLDGFGGLHPFTTPGHPLPPFARTSGYWPGQDLARGVSILPDGTGGYVIDRTGRVSPFSIGNNPAPPRPGPNAPYSPGGDWARGFTFVPPMPASATASRHRSTPTPTPGPTPIDRHRTLEDAPR